jgi:hypothetical protein
MRIDVFLAALREYLSAKKDYETGQAEQRLVDDARRRVAAYLNQYIDSRIYLALEQRRRKQSSDRIQLADTINSAMKSTASTFKSMKALSTAPPPPNDPTDKQKMDEWQKSYAEWYENTRKNGMTIG